jgi:hypothetical protein
MLAGKFIRFVAFSCVCAWSVGADRATAQVAIVGGSTSVVTSGMTVGTIGPWSSSGYSTSFGSYYGGGWGNGYGGGWGGSYSGGGWGGPYYDEWGGAPYWSGVPYGPGYYALPPLVVPAELLYGPGPVRRLMGIDPPLGTPIVNNTIINLPSQAQGFGVLAPGAQVPARPAGVRASNAQARDLAKRQIAAGDTLFAKQQFAQALEAYRQAARAAPDLADSHFRQMVALVALGRYETAVDAVKNGMRVSKDTINGQFRIPAMYGDNQIARTAHLEALAKVTTDRPTSDLYFLTGVMLFFDNPPQRSAPFFEQAAGMAIAERWHIDVFREVLKRLPAEAAQAPAGNGPAGNGPAANGPAGNGPAANGPAASGPANVPVNGPVRVPAGVDAGAREI